MALLVVAISLECRSSLPGTKRTSEADRPFKQLLLADTIARSEPWGRNEKTRVHSVSAGGRLRGPLQRNLNGYD
jgi:hypothetical protein